MKPISYRMENAGRYRATAWATRAFGSSVAPQSVVQRKDVAEIILDVLRSSPTPVAKTELSKLVGRKAEVTRQAIDELTKGGKIVEQKQGRTKLYSLPENARANERSADRRLTEFRSVFCSL
ncbi:MAG: hypothetical protein IPM35_33600 [Myxococcales bacterium]|nr:hypothetical protein [Myxococcales bacterium]